MEMSVKDLAVHGSLFSINYSLNLLEQTAGQKEWCRTWHNCYSNPLLPKWKQQRVLVFKRLMVAKPKGELARGPTYLRLYIRRQTLQQIFDLVTIPMTV